MKEKAQPFGEGKDRGLAVRDASREGNAGKGRRPGRSLAIFKAFVLLVLVAITVYGMLKQGLYSGSLLPRPVAEVLGLGGTNPSFEDLWLPVDAVVLGLLFVTLFARGFYRDVPRVGVVLVALLAALAAIKGLSMVWTISETETVKEMLRCSFYAAAFLMALGAVGSSRQVGPLVDIALLLVVAVAGYGLLQKISPIEYPILSPDGVRIDSTLGYANTVAMVLGMGVALALARMTAARNALVRGLYAAIVVAFLAALYLTLSRGGMGSLGLGLVVLFVLAQNRLQMLANLLLASVPFAWLYWRMQGLGALLSGSAPEGQRIADGTAFRDYLLIALAVAFVLQVAYALLAGRYETTPRTRRALGALVIAGAVLAVGAGAFSVVAGYGGVGKAYEELFSDPEKIGSTSRRLTSFGLGLRQDYWAVAWEAWKERPLTGTGAGTFHYTWLEERTGTQSVRQVHNLYLEQGTETGVFAFLALLGFAALLVWHTARAAWRSSGERRLLLAGLASALAIYLVSSFLEWHWYIPGATLFFFVLAGVAAKYASMHDGPGERSFREDPAGMGAPENGR